MLLIPAIDLKNGQCVRLRQGRLDDVTVFSNEGFDKKLIRTARGMGYVLEAAFDETVGVVGGAQQVFIGVGGFALAIPHLGVTASLVKQGDLVDALRHPASAQPSDFG